MPKPDFVQMDVQCWMHPGKFGVTEPTICLHHRAAELGRPIIQALDELSTETPPSSRMLTFLPSSQKHVLTAIPLRCVATRNELRLVHISCRQETVTVEMTQVGLDVLRDALTAWFLGQEDFRVSPRHAKLNRDEWGPLDKSSGELWFWGPGYAGP